MNDIIKTEILSKVAGHFDHTIHLRSQIWVGGVLRWLMYGPSEKVEDTPNPNDLLDRYGIDYAQLCIITYLWKRLHNHMYYNEPQKVKDFVLNLISSLPIGVEHSTAYHRYLVELMQMIKPFTHKNQEKYVNDCIQFHLTAIESKPGFSQYSQFYGSHYEMRVVGASVDPASVNIMLSAASNIIAHKLRDEFPLTLVNMHADIHLLKFTMNTWGRIGEDGSMGVREGAYQADDTSNSETLEADPVGQAASIVREITGATKKA